MNGTLNKDQVFPGADGMTGRTIRFHGRHALRSITTVPRCMDCGREAHGNAVAMRRTESGIVGFAGLVSCGRVWLCPVCNAKIMAKRAVEIGAVLTWAMVEGYQVLWGSLTCRHDSQSDLADLIRIQKSAWDHVVSSKSWRKSSATTTAAHVHVSACAEECERKRDAVLLPIDGRVGFVRAAELTTGFNGWHPHFHPMIFVRGTVDYAQSLADSITQKWVEGVKDAGGDAQLYGSQELKVVVGFEAYDKLAGYVTKQTYDASAAAMELVWSQGKNARGRVDKTISHWGLLAAVDKGLADESLKWLELEQATAGHRMLTWSRGLRYFAGIGDETTDEEEAAREVGSSADDVCFITGDGWLGIRDRPEILGLLLDVLSSSGWRGLKMILDAHGIEYIEAAEAGSYERKAQANV